MPSPIPNPGTMPQEEPRKLSIIERSMLANDIQEACRTVYDPEIPVNVYDLGLIYDIQISDEKDVHIVMTLTSPACPVAGTLPGEVQMAVGQVPWVRNATLDLTWDPPFTLDMVSEEVKLDMGWM